MWHDATKSNVPPAGQSDTTSSLPSPAVLPVADHSEAEVRGGDDAAAPGAPSEAVPCEAGLAHGAADPDLTAAAAAIELMPPSAGHGGGGPLPDEGVAEEDRDRPPVVVVVGGIGREVRVLQT